MIRLITFCDESMVRSAAVCITSSREHGAEQAQLYTHEQLKQTDFYQDNLPLLSQARGLGFWAWKPYVILDLMKECNEGDIAIYMDAGVEIINNLRYIVDRMDQDIFLFGNLWDHVQWCKRDIIEAIMPGTPWEAFGKQVQASAIFIRVNDQTKAFVKEWLDWCLFENGRLIDDSPSRTPNHPEFGENRYDQSVLTTLAYREGAALHWWPASYRGGAVYPPFKENRHDQAILTTLAYRDKIALHHWPVKYDLGGRFWNHEHGHYEDDYPVLFLHHRRRNHEWERVA